MTDPIALAAKIEERAAKIAAGVLLEVAANYGGRDEFMAIMLHAVERRIMDMRHEGSGRRRRK